MPFWGGGTGSGGAVTPTPSVIPTVQSNFGTNHVTLTPASAVTDFPVGTFTRGDTIVVESAADSVRRTYLVLAPGDGSWTGSTKVDITGMEPKSYKVTPTDNQLIFTLPEQPKKPTATTISVNGVSYNAYPPNAGITLSGLNINWTGTFKLHPTDDVVINYM